MSKFNVQKVTSLPTPLVANTIYYVKGTIANDPVNVYVTNSGGTLVAVPAGWRIMTNQPFSNINNFTDYETYYRGAFQSVGWPGGSNYMNIFSLKFQDPVAVSQLGFSQGNKAFMRYGVSGSFGAWQEFWHTGNLPNPVLKSSQSVKHISAGIMTTASNNSYQSIFSTGSNILSNALKFIDVSKRKIYDVININVVFVNKTTNSDKLGILRFEINSGGSKSLEVFSFNSDPYSGNFTIKIIYLGSDNYSIIGNAYTSVGIPTAVLSSFLFTQSITTDLQIKIDFSSSIAASTNYGGNTDIYHEIDYKSSDDSIFLEDPV
jgi:hypothetical protein